MVIFDTLEIVPSGKDMLVEAHVPEDCDGYMKDVYIKSIAITSDLNPQKNVMPKQSNENTLFYFDFHLNKEDEPERYPKKIALIIRDCVAALSNTRAWMNVSTFKDHLFYVWIETTGPVGECAPCAMHNTKTVGVVYNKEQIYNIGYNFLKELSDTCQIPVGFTDYTLQLNALNTTIETGNYREAEKIFSTLLKLKKPMFSGCGCGCGCHG